MTKEEIAIKLYEVSNSQFLSRLRQRDIILLFFVASVGTIGGIVAGNNDISKELLFAIPYFAFACGMIMAYHSIFIEALVKYNHDVINRSIEKDIAIFEASMHFSRLGMLGVLLRSIGYVVILAFPTGVSLYITSDMCCSGLISKSLFWYTSLILGILGISSIFFADLYHIRKVQSRVSVITEPNIHDGT